MTQPNLLDSAKQGDPEAIAKLMNFTLQPKGITAEAQRQGDCLEVFLTSNRALNSTALVSFVQKGITNLGVLSIQTVKVYGKKVGEDSPAWAERFEISGGGSVTGDSSTSENPAVSQSSSPVMDSSVKPARPLFDRHWQKQFPAVSVNLNQLKTFTKRLGLQTRKRLDHWLAIAERATSQRRLYGTRVPARVRSSKYARALMVAVLPAFLLGAIAAVVASMAQGGSSQTGMLQSSNALSGGKEVNPPSQAQLEQQAEVRTYLDKMNKAQRNFYLKNGRFASSLEELERSADVISLVSQSHYTYKLTVSHGTQAQLTAVPKAKGLKSFTGVVQAAKTGSSSRQAVTTICESNQPSQVPPLVQVPESSQIQCPAESARIS